jgi:hypothetical protein
VPKVEIALVAAGHANTLDPSEPTASARLSGLAGGKGRLPRTDTCQRLTWAG